MNEMNSTWKEKQLYYLESFYGKYTLDCGGKTDERHLYLNLYYMMRDGIKSLPDEPDFYVKCAVTHEIQKDAKRMDRIIKKFWA